MEELCFHCKSEELFEDLGHVTCANCGRIQKYVLAEMDEISYSHEGITENNSRVGHVIGKDNPFESLSTYIPKGTFVTVTKSDGTSYKKDLSKINMMFSQTSKEKSYSLTTQRFDILSDKIPKNVIQYAKSIWSAIAESNQKIYRGSNRNGILGCCILFACYHEGTPMTRKDLCEIMDLTTKDITNGEPIFRNLVRDTEFKDILNYTSKSSSSVSFSRMLDELNIPFKNIQECESMYRRLKTSSMKDKSIIAGILSSVVLNNKLERPSKKEIAEYVGITLPTLNKALKSIEVFLRQ